MSPAEEELAQLKRQNAMLLRALRAAKAEIDRLREELPQRAEATAR